jgi:hypothetical protein
MKNHLFRMTAAVSAALSLVSFSAQAGQKDVKQVQPPAPAPDSWEFKMAIPGWLAATSGTVGVGRFSADVYMGADTLLENLDGIATFSLEARKGRFGIYGDFLYASVSDGVQTSGLISSVNMRLDQYLADLELFYRVVDTPRGFFDLRAGVRYNNIYTQASISPNDDNIDAASERFVDLVTSDIDRVVRAALEGVLDGNHPPVPVPPLNARQKARVLAAVVVARRNPELVAALKAQATATADADKAAAEARVNAAKNKVQNNLSKTLKKTLNRTASECEYWFDPYVGFRGQYNFNKAWYLTGKGDIGGFGLGSEITFQLYGALGCQISRNFFVEAGYRYLYSDYDQDGFLYNVTQSGAQITFGINF